MKDTEKGSFLIIFAVAIFGLYGVFIRFIAASPEFILFFMSVIVTIVFALGFLKKKTLFSVRNHRKAAILIGLAGVGNNLSYFMSFKLTTIANATLAHYTAPIFVAIMAPFFLREKLEKSTVAALLMSFIGLSLISNGIYLGSDQFLGIALATLSGLFYALSIILYKRMKDLPIYTIIFYQFFIGMLILIPFAAMNIPILDVSNIIWLLIFAGLFGIFAILIHLNGIKRVKAQHAGILGYAEPLAATAYAILLFSEVPTLFTIIGGLLIAAGGYIVIKLQKKEI